MREHRFANLITVCDYTCTRFGRDGPSNCRRWGWVGLGYSGWPLHVCDANRRRMSCFNRTHLSWGHVCSVSTEHICSVGKYRPVLFQLFRLLLHEIGLDNTVSEYCKLAHVPVCLQSESSWHWCLAGKTCQSQMRALSFAIGSCWNLRDKFGLGEMPWLTTWSGPCQDHQTQPLSDSRSAQMPVFGIQTAEVPLHLNYTRKLHRGTSGWVTHCPLLSAAGQSDTWANCKFDKPIVWQLVLKLKVFKLHTCTQASITNITMLGHDDRWSVRMLNLRQMITNDEVVRVLVNSGISSDRWSMGFHFQICSREMQVWLTNAMQISFVWVANSLLWPILTKAI